MNDQRTPVRRTGGPGEWVLLSYRIPREPSTPRIAIWRKLKRLGVAQLGDGLVALPADARTREQLEWMAEEAIEAGGTAGVWLARPATAAQEREIATAMAAARAAEYAQLAAEAEQSAAGDAAGHESALRRLRAELRRITRRDYFPPPERDRARAAIEHLATGATAVPSEEESLS
ncbi:Chromate resistance protein ChrB [Streptomyces sp. NPDC048527]|uniref:Chromate resistance protein ChrB n=1 Tax=Streptomyces sp. NPDC048527 TaxID=3365568 RepID=UPI00371B4808